MPADSVACPVLDPGKDSRPLCFQPLCFNNAPVQSFFSSLKNELARHPSSQSQAEAQVAIEDYIDRCYYRQRLHQALGCQSPEEFEKQAGES